MNLAKNQKIKKRKKDKNRIIRQNNLPILLVIIFITKLYKEHIFVGNHAN